MKAKLSTLWIFLVLNFAYCDLLALHDPSYLKDLLSGHVGGIDFTPGFLLGASILMEVSISMVLLSRLAKYKINRWANIIASAFLALIQTVTLFVGSAPSPSYIFFSIIEITTLLFIVWFAWNWKSAKAK